MLDANFDERIGVGEIASFADVARAPVRRMSEPLSQTDILRFRERACRVAEQLFLESGPGAVTMRQVAAKLGVSHMTPYRYFRDRKALLAALKTAATDRLSEALELAETSASSSATGVAAINAAYVDFALEHPHRYRLAFQLDAGEPSQCPDLRRATQRLQSIMSRQAQHLSPTAPRASRLDVALWASTHGLLALELAGKLAPGATRRLHEPMVRALVLGLRTDPVDPPSQ